MDVITSLCSGLCLSMLVKRALGYKMLLTINYRITLKPICGLSRKIHCVTLVTDHSLWLTKRMHYNDVIMSAMASQITSLTIVHSAVYSGEDQRKHQSSASLAFVRGIHRWPVNSPHKGPVTRKMIPFDDVIMATRWVFRHTYFSDASTTVLSFWSSWSTTFVFNGFR